LSVTLAENLAVDEIVLAGCGRFPVVPSRADLERFCFLDDSDRRLIAKRRGDHNRLGFALQVVTVRYLGTFLADPLDVPAAVSAFVAGQLEIADTSCVKAYLEREKTRFEHEWVMAEAYGWRSFADGEAELAGWVEDRAWTTGDGPETLSDAAVVWLRERRVLLPGVTTLARLVAPGAGRGAPAPWDTLAALLTGQQARQLDLLLEVPEGSRTSDLERFRTGPITVSGKALAAALDRAAEIAALRLGDADLSGVPRRRVVELARYSMAGKAPALRRRPDQRRLATLLATVVYLEAKAVDDALELFDVLMTNDLLARANRESRDEKARRYPAVSRDAGKLAAAVAVLLAATDGGGDVSLEAIWDAIETVVSRSELRAAVASITEVVPACDADPDGEWRTSLVERFAVVRRFLPQLCATIRFGRPRRLHRCSTLCGTCRGCSTAGRPSACRRGTWTPNGWP